jgi:hypothetical protein
MTFEGKVVFQMNQILKRKALDSIKPYIENLLTKEVENNV